MLRPRACLAVVVAVALAQPACGSDESSDSSAPASSGQSFERAVLASVNNMMHVPVRMFFGDPRTGDEREVQIAHAGDFVHIPRGEIHGLENVSDTEEAHLVFCYPGVPDKEGAETIFVE